MLCPVQMQAAFPFEGRGQFASATAAQGFRGRPGLFLRRRGMQDYLFYVIRNNEENLLNHIDFNTNWLY